MPYWMIYLGIFGTLAFVGSVWLGGYAIARLMIGERGYQEMKDRQRREAQR